MNKLLTLVLLAACASAAWADGTPCEGLTKLSLPNTTINSATLIAQGTFTPPRNNQGPPPPPAAPNHPPAAPPAQGPNQNAIYSTLPTFCRVLATVRPVSDSEIKIEVWLPAENWNGRLEAVGNGGFSSSIQYNALAQAVQKGYAGTATNTGFDGNDSSFSIGHIEKQTDWGNRAVHEMAITAKLILAAHYGSGPKYSYWNACSTGGRQGWVAAEYYPNDFDGLAIGDPANPMTRLQANNIAVYLALNKTPDSFITPAQWTMIHDRVLAECDAKDGLKDGLIENPLACNFDVNSLLCKSGDSADCLTATLMTALNQVVNGSRNPRTGEQLYPGYPLGTVMNPGPIAGKNGPDSSAPSTFRMLFQDANWDFHTFDFDKDTARADQLGNSTINAVDPAKLKPLFSRGGKILLYHGWEDPAITPLEQIALYDSAVKANGGLDKTYNNIRLFMVPGMAHCGGGEGPNTFDKMDAISAWVERGQAPEQILASHSTAGKVDRTRPLCPYPQVAKYKGTGSIDEAANFTCVKP